MKCGFRTGLFAVSLLLLLGCTAGTFLCIISPTTAFQPVYNSFATLETSLADLQVALFKTQTLSFMAGSESLANTLLRVDTAFGSSELYLIGQCFFAHAGFDSIGKMADSMAGGARMVEHPACSSEYGQSLFGSTYQKITKISDSIPALTVRRRLSGISPNRRTCSPLTRQLRPRMRDVTNTVTRDSGLMSGERLLSRNRYPHSI